MPPLNSALNSALNLPVNSILKSDLHFPSNRILSVETLFQQMLHYRERNRSMAALGPWLQQRVSDCAFPPLNRVPFAATTYTRNWIARESYPRSQQQPHKFEALLLRWDRQAKTPIHGHPAFSFYHIVGGTFEIERFSQTAAGDLRLDSIQRCSPADTFWALGTADRYDNDIHRITCLEPGLTFHIYSEDARKGLCYGQSR